MARTRLVLLIFTTQAVLLRQSPLHPAKRHPFAGLTDSRTERANGNDAAHVLVHEMPAGVLVTRP